MRSSGLEAQIAEIQTALLERCDALGARTADAVWRSVDYYGDTGQIGKDELTADCRTTLRSASRGDWPGAKWRTWRPPVRISVGKRS